jgi:hypothetical protein
MSSPYITGPGWGMKHRWMTIQGLVPVDTPCNTQTAYTYKLFTQLYKVTGKHEYLEYLKKIVTDLANDFPEWEEGDTLVCSYSTIDKGR